MSKDNREPAFPSAQPFEEGIMQWNTTHCWGMSLRDWFAGMALRELDMWSGEKYAAMAKTAYQVADAMLAERSKSDD